MDNRGSLKFEASKLRFSGFKRSISKCVEISVLTSNGIRIFNMAVYTAISVACGWAGAVLSLCKPQNSEICDQKLDDTDQPTN